MYWISSRGQPTGGVPPAWGLDGGLTTHHRKTLTCYETHHRASDQDGFCGKTTQAPKNGWDLAPGMLGASIG
jgi:hypothetical protein